MNIPQERLNAFASTAATFGDIPGVVTAIRQIHADRATLLAEGRANALKGADRLLAGCARRLCATAARSEREAETKRETLAELRQVFHAGNGESHGLVGAMLEAAIASETDAWPPQPVRH